MNQDVRTTVEEEETLAEVPDHVFNTLPDEVKLFPSAVNKARIGVWSTQRILKGRKFGPFVGEKKKRSQVKNNVYMWEVYYPNLGWMCIDATDPKKGSWLRYVNWARSAKEQNLCPLEIKRAIYYKTLKPIEPGEELLVWYNGEENPEIAAAIEEERAKHRIRRRHSPKAKKGRRKSLEGKKKANKNIGVRQRKADSGHSSADMRDSEEGIKEDDENPSLSAVLSLEQTALIQEMVNQDALPKLMPALPSYEPQIMAREKLDSVTRERLHQSESQKENSENEYVLEGLEKHEHLEESKSTSEETPESSPKKKVSARTPKIKTEPNGDLLDSFLFPCQHCERKFTTKQGLERHMHIHVSSFEHAFKCRYCGKAFGTQINRRRHERRHEAGPKRKPTPLASDDFSDNSAALDEPSLKTTEEKNASSLAQDCKILESEPFGQETTHPYVKEEYVEGRGFHPCRYCKKVFGTHINMRRHQRRVHERHLLPKGVRRKGLLEEKQFPREQTQPSQSVYTTSTELDEEGETDDVYIMDVSNNISENLNYYIDGKIESNGSTSNCEVIEVQSNPAEMYKLNCLIAPVKIELSQNVMSSQTPTTDNLKESSSSIQIESKKRRTTSPPLLTSLKTEIKAEPITTSCPLNLPLTVSVSDNLPFHKEKSVFLSSKLKQLLQTQDGSKLSPSLLTEVPKLVPTVSSAIPTVCSRFKRRTSTPPSSPQHSPGLRDFGKQMDGKLTWHEGLNTKIPKIESHGSSPAWSLSGRDERENISPLCNDDFKMAKDWTTNLSLSSSCNQQPLDLSSGVKQRFESKCSPGPWESVLDLSIHKKACDIEVKEQENSLMHTSCGSIKKKKPTTCMLQKVLLNEYDGKDITLEDAPCLSSSPGPCQSGQQPLSEKVSFASSISVMSPSHILQISDSTLPLLIPTYVTAPLSFRTEFTIATRPLPSPAILPPLAEPSITAPVSSFTSRPPSPAIISSVPEPSISIPVSSLTFPPLLPIPSLLENSNVIPILPCSPPPPSPTVLPSLPELSNTAPVHSQSSLQSPPAVVSLLPEATNITPAPSPTPPPPIVHTSLTKQSNLILTRSCASPPPSAKVHSSLPKYSNVSPTRSCTSPLSNKSAHSPLPVLSPTESHSPSPVPTDDGSISSPGPPTLSSSSTSSSDSSDSSDSSSCSSSPPPLSVASFAVSPLSKIIPTAFIKQEVIEEQVTPKETLRVENEESPIKDTFTKNFVCNVCESPFPSIKELKKHLSAHAEEWPFKCEFCVQLCKDTASLTDHRFSLHGVGKIFICSICKKEFAFMCNLQQHQQDVHPDKEYTHHEFESGTLRPQNFTDPSKADLSHLKSLPDPLCHEEDGELDDSSEELYTTIKIMASGEKPSDPDVRMGINQHYPSFKPPPFQYHNRNPLGIGATATNFTTHNIPQTFSTAIRCTKCGKGVDNLPELHKHILVCASASDKKRYTPKKNPIPLKHTTPPKTGLPSMDSSEKNAFRRAGQPKKMLFNVENGKMSGSKLKMNALKKKNQLVHKAILQKKKSARQKSDIKTNLSNSEPLTCPYCNRVFTYSGSLSKHAAYSCPKKPVSPVSKKNGSPPSKKYGKAMSSASKKKSSSKRRRTADAEIKMQSTETHLGKTRARSSEPPPLPSPPSPSLPPSSIKPKQNVKYVPSVKPNKQSSPPIKQSSPPLIRSASPVRMLKITQLVELKKVKTGSLNNPSTSSSKMPGKLHVRVKKNTAILKRKSSLAHERRIERTNIKLKKKPSRPITRSSQHATSTDTIENKKEDSIGKQELRDLRNLL